MGAFSFRVAEALMELTIEDTEEALPSTQVRMRVVFAGKAGSIAWRRKPDWDLQFRVVLRGISLPIWFRGLMHRFKLKVRKLRKL